MLNLWPRDDPCQPLDEVPLLDEVQIIDGGHAANYFLQQTNPADCAALCIFGHGTERAAGPPFRLANGETWQLPTAHGLPPLVILLACGNDRGNLLDTGHSLLAAGAQTVLTPLGRPTAPGASRFLQTFLPIWQAGETVATALLAAQCQDSGQEAACRLQLLGQGELRLAAILRITEAPLTSNSPPLPLPVIPRHLPR